MRQDSLLRDETRSTLTNPLDWREDLKCATLVDLLRLRQDSTTHLHFLDERLSLTTVTYADVCRGAFRFAGKLRALGVKPGARVALMLANGIDYAYAFFGAIAVGAIPVPLCLPANPHQIVQYQRTLSGILDNSQASVLIYWARLKDVIGSLLSKHPHLQHVLALEDFADAPAGSAGDLPQVAPADLAVLQYTSGSTAQPKGVEWSHTNLLHNIKTSTDRIQLDASKDRVLSWLPLYHNFGLGLLLWNFYCDSELFLMSPLTFVMRPKSWLQAITTHKITMTAAPNFAFNLAAKGISDKAARELDLSTVSRWACGAEPIRWETFVSFRERFAPYGFRPEAFICGYGMAESTVAVSAQDLGNPERVLWVDRNIQDRVVICSPDDAEARAVFSLGPPSAQSSFKIVAESTGQELPGGSVGEVLLQGPSVMRGYFRDPVKTAEVLRDGWLHTGDRGFIHNDQLYVCGRSKDLVIRNGHNYYPTDLEEIVDSVEGVSKNNVIAFGYSNPVTASDEVVVLAETALQGAAEHDQLRAAIKAAVARAVGFVPDKVELLPPETLLKTAAGKLRRLPTKALYLNGNLKPARDRLVDQVKIVVGSKLAWSKRFLQKLVVRT